jgi:superfamily II helicase
MKMILCDKCGVLLDIKRAFMITWIMYEKDFCCPECALEWINEELQIKDMYEE